MRRAFGTKTPPGLAVLTAVFLSSMPAGCERDIRPAPESDEQTAQVSLFNATHDVLPVETRPLDPGYGLDCEIVADDPTRFLRSEHLSTPADDAVYSGIEIPIDGVDDHLNAGGASPPDCYFNVVSTADDRLPELVVGWPADLAEKTFYTDVDAPADIPPEPQTLVAEANYEDVPSDQMRPWRSRPCGGSIDDCSPDEYDDVLAPPSGAEYAWSVRGEMPDKYEFDLESVDDLPIGDDDPDCPTGRHATPLSWDEPPSGTWRVDAVDDADNGDSAPEETNAESGEDELPAVDDWSCHAVTLKGDDGDERNWEFCGSERLASRLASKEKIGSVYIDFHTETQYSSPPAAYETLTLDLERKTDDGELYETEMIEAMRSQGIPEYIGLDWDTELISGCEPRREVGGCNQIGLPLKLHIESSGGLLEIPAGRTDYLDPQSHRQIEVVRAIHRSITDRECRDRRLGPRQFSETGPYFELVYYTGIARVGESSEQ